MIRNPVHMFEKVSQQLYVHNLATAGYFRMTIIQEGCIGLKMKLLDDSECLT